MRSPLPSRVTHASFPTCLMASRFVLLGLGPAPVTVQPALVAYLQSRWSDALSVITLDTSRPVPRGFWEQLLRAQAGPMRLPPGGPERGTYLFDSGLVVGFHRGGASLSAEYDALRPDIERAWGQPLPLRGAEVILGEAGYFAGILAQRQGRTEDPWATPREQAPPPYGGSPYGPQGGPGHAEPPPRSEPPPRRPPARPPPPPPKEDYALLGVEPSVTDAELTLAYKNQMKLNHPDKVAHLSPALQKFAEQQTVAIQLAYRRLRALRKG